MTEEYKNNSLLKRIWQFITNFGDKEEVTLRESFDEILEEFDEDVPIDPQGRAIIENILRIGSKSAYDVMVPRVDIAAIRLDTKLDELVRLMIEKPHSRYPVYGEDMDEIEGMVHIKDVFAASLEKGRRISIKKLVREVLFVAPKMPVLDLLLEMRSTRKHMALVVDEYGGIDGLVTIEDLVEEIVGEIEDEHDIHQGDFIEPLPDGCFKAHARLPLEDLEKAIGEFLTDEEREEDIDTLGGLIFHLCGRVPSRGELIVHPESGIEFSVLRADPRRIRLLKISPRPVIPAPETP